MLNIDFSSPRLRNYAAAIKAQFLRIGGSEDVDIKYLYVGPHSTGKRAHAEVTQQHAA